MHTLSRFFLLTGMALLLFVSLCGAFERPWHQEVSYFIDVTLAKDLRTISGTVEIEYTNYSPDPLPVIYLKAFPNAIQPYSYADQWRRDQADNEFSRLEPEQQGSLELRRPEGINESELTYRSFETDNTIIAVYLSRPLEPDETVTMPFEFTTVLPSPARMRMGKGRGVTKAVYWYPQACVYDHRAGWVNAQYLGHGENYGDFGAYVVSITAPENLVIAATGVCENENEVLPDSLREMLALGNFLKPPEQWPEFAFNDDSTKTWRFIAENVNDFAWTASANWCIVTDSAQGAEVVAYALRHKAESWQNAARIAAQAIDFYSERFYPYQYPVMRICDAFSGMEFPMLTNCGNGAPDPFYEITIYHEVAHQWFMGMVGSNPRDEAFMDEGFAMTLELLATEHFMGREANLQHHTNALQELFAPDLSARNERVYWPIYNMLHLGYSRPMALIADHEADYRPFANAIYRKGAAMHLSLMSILGDSVYFDAMNLYCDRWLFGHPYKEDFTRALEDATGIQFERYLEQWYYGDAVGDYSFDDKDTRTTADGFEHKIRIKRHNLFTAPLDVAIIWNQGDTTFYTIPPENMAYQKPNYILLPVWDQFRMASDAYEFTITSRRKLQKVLVDPFELIPDIDRRNNSSGFIPWPTNTRFDNLLFDFTPANAYAIRMRPDIWYDDVHGALLGFHWHSSYHEVVDRFRFDLMFGLKSGRPVVDIERSSPMAVFGPQSEFRQRLLYHGYRTLFRVQTTKRWKPFHSREDGEYFSVILDYLSTHKDQRNRLDTLPSAVVPYVPDGLWDGASVYSAKVVTGTANTWTWGGMRFINRETFGAYEEDERYRAFLESQFEWVLTFRNAQRNWLSLRLEWLNTEGEPPSQYLQQLSRRPSIDRFTENWVFRTPGTFPVEWEPDFYLASRRVRGYLDRQLFLLDYFGGSIEVTPPDMLPYSLLRSVPLVGKFLSSCDQTLFVDAGQFDFKDKQEFYPEPVAGSYGADEQEYYDWWASAGVSLNFPSLWRGQTVRADFPIYLSHPSEGEDEVEFRFSVAWLLPLEL